MKLLATYCRLIYSFGRDSLSCFTPESVVVVPLRARYVKCFCSFSSFRPTSVMSVFLSFKVVKCLSSLIFVKLALK
jgi:hypothetical protein